MDLYTEMDFKDRKFLCMKYSYNKIKAEKLTILT